MVLIVFFKEPQAVIRLSMESVFIHIYELPEQHKYRRDDFVTILLPLSILGKQLFWNIFFFSKKGISE